MIAGHVALSALTELPGNPKLHSSDEIATSIRRFGFLERVVVNKTTGHLLSGHGRLGVLKAMRAANEKPPKNVTETVSDWLVPVDEVEVPEVEEGAAAVAVNRLVETGGWDNEKLMAILDEMKEQPLGLEGLGWTNEAITEIADEMLPERPDSDSAPPPPTAVRSKRGDLWILGEHRLLCGDSTDAADVARLMGTEKAVVLATDPPYGVDFVATKDAVLNTTRITGKDVDGDDLDPDEVRALMERVLEVAAPHLTPTCAFYLWQAFQTQQATQDALVARGILLHRQIVWVKPRLVMARSGMYHWKHEVATFGWVKGNQPPWYGDKGQTSVIEAGRDEDAGQHPTQKPVALFEFPMANHALNGEVCYEPFSGSGSQIIAGERLKRRVFAIELEPRYVDVAIMRWQAFAKAKAVREADRVPFDNVVPVAEVLP